MTESSVLERAEENQRQRSEIRWSATSANYPEQPNQAWWTLRKQKQAPLVQIVVKVWLKWNFLFSSAVHLKNIFISVEHFQILACYDFKLYFMWNECDIFTDAHNCELVVRKIKIIIQSETCILSQPPFSQHFIKLLLFRSGRWKQSPHHDSATTTFYHAVLVFHHRLCTQVKVQFCLL